MQRLAAIGLVLAITSTLGGTIAIGQAPAVPPHIFVFENYDENLATLTFSEVTIRTVPVVVTRINAAGVEETTKELTMEYAESRNTHLLAETAVRTFGGKELDRKVAAKELKKGQPVILVVKGVKPSETFKSLFRDDVIVIEVKSLGTDPALDPAPAPPKK